MVFAFFSVRTSMAKRKYREVEMNRDAEELEAEGTAPEIGRELGVSKDTIYGWKAKYWGCRGRRAAAAAAEE